ncbi:MAG: CDP-diacylglycerol--glycerol-3-phosphate 3-phosphatidyltransferase [Clostridiales bacterium]|jgi:CDP-diacylglycerol--glycerol-3-phosphate 3-phosphatidyltransferase|nr:CDP-diacylglycerol--glycerol-3-phosphate 3-phosphatidyltransferase [Clostridiales bacterium]
MNIPNALTMTRMALVPVFVACFYLPTVWAHMIAAIVFLLAYVTDILDGQLARRRNDVTNFGKLMDPVADKLLSGSAFIMLSARGLLSPVAAITIIGREFIISGFRLVAVQKGKVIAASWPGKLKTVTQCVAVILALCWRYTGIGALHVASDAVVWACVGVTVWSCADYFVKNKGMIDLK